MATNWTIYYDHEYPNGGKSTTCVLLTDGAWTDQSNCNRRETFNAERDGDGIVMHRPKLFATRGGALNYKKTRLGELKCYRIAKYVGPTDPDARPAITHDLREAS